MAGLLDKDLSDDMLKLVRYKVLFVRREYEVAFPEHEDLVADNLTPNSFVAWKIAEFIQDLQRGNTPVPSKWVNKGYPQNPDPPAPPYEKDGKLYGLPPEDKKYLRIYYEVRDRYPREKFKYEQQQIRVLEEIRDALGKTASQPPPGSPSAGTTSAPQAPSSPYDDLLDQLHLSAQTFHDWQENFRRCAAPIAQQLSSFFAQYQDLGGIPTPPITPEEIEHALAGPASSARETLNSFAGSGDNILHVFVRKQGIPPADVQVPPNHSTRAPAAPSTHPGISYLQKVAESYSQPVNPEDGVALQNALTGNQVDLHLHAHSNESGLVSWSSLNQGGAQRMRAIAYALEGKVLFFKQMLNADLTPFTGPMPQAEFVNVVPDQFIVALDFLLPESGRNSVCTCAMPMNFDFQKCTAEFPGLVLKFRRD